LPGPRPRVHEAPSGAKRQTGGAEAEVEERRRQGVSPFGLRCFSGKAL
jgi:hypothetical protein